MDLGPWLDRVIPFAVERGGKLPQASASRLTRQCRMGLGMRFRSPGQYQAGRSWKAPCAGKVPPESEIGELLMDPGRDSTDFDDDIFCAIKKSGRKWSRGDIAVKPPYLEQRRKAQETRSSIDLALVYLSSGSLPSVPVQPPPSDLPSEMTASAASARARSNCSSAVLTSASVASNSSSGSTPAW